MRERCRAGGMISLRSRGATRSYFFSQPSDIQSATKWLRTISRSSINLVIYKCTDTLIPPSFMLVATHLLTGMHRQVSSKDSWMFMKFDHTSLRSNLQKKRFRSGIWSTKTWDCSTINCSDERLLIWPISNLQNRRFLRKSNQRARPTCAKHDLFGAG